MYTKVLQKMQDKIMSNHTIIEDLLASLPKDAVPVRSVLVGAHWTAVCSTNCGLATTITGNKPHDHTTVVRDAGRLHEKAHRILHDMPCQETLSKPGSALPLSTRFWK